MAQHQSEVRHWSWRVQRWALPDCCPRFPEASSVSPSSVAADIKAIVALMLATRSQPNSPVGVEDGGPPKRHFMMS
jgi:hypothetical protein